MKVFIGFHRRSTEGSQLLYTSSKKQRSLHNLFFEQLKLNKSPENNTAYTWRIQRKRTKPSKRGKSITED